MDRPYIFCHMMTSVNGKINGPFLDTPEIDTAGKIYYDIASIQNSYYDYQAWLVGRVTAAGDFAGNGVLKLDKNVEFVPEGDFVKEPDVGMYYAVVDTGGKLAWEKNEITYINTRAHIIEILTGTASNEYKDFLRKKGISYIIAGEESLDYGLALFKLKSLFGIERAMLGGGAMLNDSFIRAGMCDELSLVIAPIGDDAAGSPSVFEERNMTAENRVFHFQLKGAEIMDGGCLWLRYDVKEKEEREE